MLGQQRVSLSPSRSVGSRCTRPTRSLPHLCHVVGVLLVIVWLGGCVSFDVPLWQAPEPPPRPPAFSAPTITAVPHPPSTPLPTTVLPVLPPLTNTGGIAPLPAPAPLRMVLWTTERDAQLELLRHHATTFSNLAGIELEVVPQSATGLRANVLAARLADQDVPDLIWGDQHVLAELLLDRQLQPAPLPTTLDSFALAARVGATADGQIWGVPLLMHHTMLLLYNRRLSDVPPDTSDDLIRMSREIAPTADGDPRGLVARWAAARWLLPFLNGFGGSPTTPDGMRPTLDTPAMASSLNLLRELAQAAPRDDTFDAGQSRFLAGDIGFVLEGDWALDPYLQSELAPDLGIAQMPVIPATGRMAAGTVDTLYLMVLNGISETKLARSREFAAYLTSTQVQVDLAYGMRRVPAVLAAHTAAELRGDPVLTLILDQSAHALGMPPTRAYRCASVAIDTQLPLIMNGDMPATEIAAAMQRQAERCVAGGR